MNYEVLKDFKRVSDVPQSLIEEYEGKITQDIINLWKEYGFGSFFNDYFRVINPHEYEEIVNDSYFDGANGQNNDEESTMDIQSTGEEYEKILQHCTTYFARER